MLSLVSTIPRLCRAMADRFCPTGYRTEPYVPLDVSSLDEPDLDNGCGPIMYPCQLKPISSGGPRYVISIGSSVAERSTVDLANHHDPLATHQWPAAPHTSMPHRPSSGINEWYEGSEKWFPMFTCRAGGDQTVAAGMRFDLHRKGYGNPWYLIGKNVPRGKILTCVLKTQGQVRNPHRECLRFWRGGQLTTVEVLTEDDTVLCNGCDTSVNNDGLSGDLDFGRVPFIRPGPWKWNQRMRAASTNRAILQRSLAERYTAVGPDGVEEQLITVVLFDDESFDSNLGGRNPSFDDHASASVNRILCNDPTWFCITNVIQRQDALFGQYSEYTTVFFSVDRETDAISRVGIGTAFIGKPDDELAATAFESLANAFVQSTYFYSNGYGNSRCEFNMDEGRERFLKIVARSMDPRRRLSGPPVVPDGTAVSAAVCDEFRRRSVATVNASDPYGWIAASCGIQGLGGLFADGYTTTVTPNISLRLGIDISPMFRLTRESAERLEAKNRLSAKRKARRERGADVRGRIPQLVTYNRAPDNDQSIGCRIQCCDCDNDDVFVTVLSKFLVTELTWFRYVSGQMDLPQSVSQTAHKDGGVSWYCGTAEGWMRHNLDDDTTLGRVRRCNPPPSRKISDGPGVPKPLNFPGRRLRTTGELRVARSNMEPWNTQCVRSMASGRTLSGTRRDHRMQRILGEFPYFLAADRNTRRRIGTKSKKRKGDAENTDCDNTINPNAVHECCLLAMVGESMLQTCRIFFSVDGKNWQALVDEIAGTVRAICTPLSTNSSSQTTQRDETHTCTYPTGTRPVIPFVFCVTSVRCDRITGARNCARLEMAFGGTTIKPDAIFYATQRLRELCNEVSMVMVMHLSTVEAVPELGLEPFRCVLEFSDEITDCCVPKVVSCPHFTSLPLHCEEAAILGSDNLWRIPNQESFCAALSVPMAGIHPPKSNVCLGLFFPLRGVRLLTADVKRRFGEYCQRLMGWLQWGQGVPHYRSLRELVPLCDCYLADVGMTNNFYGYGILFHLHCIPRPERERAIITVLAAAFRDAQRFAESSLCVDVRHV
nr:LORF11 GaAHV2 [Psittacid alphaherpesvirus 6]